MIWIDAWDCWKLFLSSLRSLCVFACRAKARQRRYCVLTRTWKRTGEHGGEWERGKGPITGGNFTARSGLKVFDVIGCWTSISSLCRIAAVNRHSVAATSITSSIELRATKVSRIITKLYRKSDRLRVPWNTPLQKYLYVFYGEILFFEFSTSRMRARTHGINMGWIVTDFYIFRILHFGE